MVNFPSFLFLVLGGCPGRRIGKTRTRALHELQYFSIRNYSVESNSIIFTRRATRLPTAFGRLPLSASVGRRTKGTPGSRTLLKLQQGSWQTKANKKCRRKMFANNFSIGATAKGKENIYIYIYFCWVFCWVFNFFSFPSLLKWIILPKMENLLLTKLTVAW